jgi:type I restriction enzyme S subunit
LVAIKHGWPFKSAHFSKELTGRPIVIGIGNFRYTGGFRFDSTDLKEYRGDYPREFELAPGDILLVMTCQTAGGEILGLPARVPSDGCTYLHNQRMGKVVFKRRDLLDSGFLYWLFLWRDFNQELVASASGTKILHTAPTRIEAFQFGLPPLDEQRAMSSLLGGFVDKIDLNRRMNRTLDALVHLLFRSWFVDFDPGVAKMDGRKPPSVPPDLAAAFSGAFVETELGPIPREWSLGAVADLARYVNGKNFTRGAGGSGRMVVRIAELNSGPGASTIYSDVSAAHENMVRAGDLLFSWSGSLGVYRWFGDEALVNQHIFKVICEGFPQWFVHQHLLDALPFFQGVAADKATTMGHIKRDHLRRVPVPLPSRDVLEAAGRVIEPLYQRILRNERESLTLVSMRDALLPKLMSGEIRLRQIHTLAEQAV